MFVDGNICIKTWDGELEIQQVVWTYGRQSRGILAMAMFFSEKRACMMEKCVKSMAKLPDQWPNQNDRHGHAGPASMCGTIAMVYGWSQFLSFKSHSGWKSKSFSAVKYLIRPLVCSGSILNNVFILVRALVKKNVMYIK